jgi:hypothetical protein
LVLTNDLRHFTIHSITPTLYKDAGNKMNSLLKFFISELNMFIVLDTNREKKASRYEKNFIRRHRLRSLFFYSHLSFAILELIIRQMIRSFEVTIFFFLNRLPA